MLRNAPKTVSRCWGSLANRKGPDMSHNFVESPDKPPSETAWNDSISTTVHETIWTNMKLCLMVPFSVDQKTNVQKGNHMFKPSKSFWIPFSRIVLPFGDLPQVLKLLGRLVGTFQNFNLSLLTRTESLTHTGLIGSWLVKAGDWKNQFDFHDIWIYQYPMSSIMGTL